MESLPWAWTPTLIWFLIGLFCVLAEFMIPGVIIVFFGAGAWIVALLTYFIPLSAALQVLIFTVTSILALMTLRKRLNPPQEIGDRAAADDFIGRIAVVQEPVRKGLPGKVTFKGALWQAETRSSYTLQTGDRVLIVDRESIVLFVEPINE